MIIEVFAYVFVGVVLLAILAFVCSLSALVCAWLSAKTKTIDFKESEDNSKDGQDFFV